MRFFLPGLIVLGWPCAMVIAQAPTPPAAAATITLGSRHGHVTPGRQGFTHTGGGNIDVAQPSGDTLVITMTGVAVAGGHPCKNSAATLRFDLDQCLEIASSNPKARQIKLTVEGRVIGLLRSHANGGGAAEQGKAWCALVAGTAEVLNLSVPPHGVSSGENLSLNCHEGPIAATLAPGQYTLHQTFTITASHPRSVLACKAASAEFAPDPALDPLWISYWEPFHGASKKDFGFQVTLKVSNE